MTNSLSKCQHTEDIIIVLQNCLNNKQMNEGDDIVLVSISSQMQVVFHGHSLCNHCHEYDLFSVYESMGFEVLNNS